MTDQVVGGTQNTFQVSSNEGYVIGSISGGTNIFRQVVYTAQDISLARAELRRVSPTNNFYTPPSSLKALRAKLEQQRFVVLYAPANYGVEYVAEFLPSVLNKDQVYYFDADATGNKLRGLLEDAERKEQVEGSVIIAAGVSARQYPPTLWPTLSTAARNRDVYVILTTTDDIGWILQNNAAFHSLATESAYTVDDLAKWLFGAVQGMQERLTQIQAIAPGLHFSTPDQTTLNGLNKNVLQLAQELGTPNAVATFIGQLRLLSVGDDAARLPGIVQAITKANKSQILARFHDLPSDEARYFILALGLLDSLDWTNGLEQGTFWTIYEQLIQEAWRERNVQLSMADYRDLTQELSAFISVDEDRIRFRNREDQRTIMDEALKTHRRALVQALPVLAGILVAEGRPAASRNTLDILDSDLYPTNDFNKRQIQLRDNVALSIARIGKYEPLTTEFLLLNWAEGPGQSASLDASVRLRLAVSRTLVQMMRLDGRLESSAQNGSEDKSATVSELLNGWYERFRHGAVASSAHISTERRVGIRSTMAVALAHLGRAMRDSGTTFGINRAVPAEIPAPDKAGQPALGKDATLWQMLLALAWDPDPAVRGSVVFGIPELLEGYPEHAEKLIELLASDWNTGVRINVARLINALIEHAPWRIYLIHRLLTLQATDTANGNVYRNLQDHTDHYLYPEWSAYDSSEVGLPASLLHRWTGTYAVVSASIRTPALLRAFLGEYVNEEGTEASQIAANALRSVLIQLIAIQGTSDDFLQNIVKPILLHSAVSKQSGALKPSLASEALQGIIKDWLNSLGFEPTVHHRPRAQRGLLLWQPPHVKVEYAPRVDADVKSLEHLMSTARLAGSDQRQPMSDLTAFLRRDAQTRQIIEVLVRNFVVAQHKSAEQDFRDLAQTEVQMLNQGRRSVRAIGVFGKQDKFTLSDLQSRIDTLRQQQ